MDLNNTAVEVDKNDNSLPLREGVDLNNLALHLLICAVRLPLREGVDLNILSLAATTESAKSPSA